MDVHEGTLQIENDDTSKKTKPILTRLGSTLGILRVDDKPLLKTLLGFTPYCDYKPTNSIRADSFGVYSSEKN